MKKLPVFLGVAAAALTLFACEKEQEKELGSPSVSAASTLSKPDLLTSGTWRQTGLTVSGTTEGSTQVASSDLFAHAKPSMLVQMAAYKPDGTYSLLRGPRAGAQTAEPTTGKWELNAAADSLIVTGTGGTRRLAVAELSASTLRLTYTDASAKGHGSTYTSVFSH